MNERVASRLERAARLEPYYTVLSLDHFLTARVAENFPEFFASGEADVHEILRMVAFCGRGAPVRDVLEFGCGPGRLLPALVKRGLTVTAVDGSPAMLRAARNNAAVQGAEGVKLWDFATFASQAEEFDLVVLNRVLQHVDVQSGLEIVRLLAARLRDDGVIYVNAPFASRRGMLSAASLRLREILPPLNALANRLRHRPSHVPVLRAHVHRVDEILAVLAEMGCSSGAFVTREENELSVATVVGRKRPAVLAAPVLDEAVVIAPAAAGEERRAAVDGMIDPQELIRSKSVEAFNALAEEYFTASKEWTAQLAKPFGSVDDAPPMLVSLGVLLQGLHLVPGMTVVDFGGGTGWLSRALAQMGCDVWLCDVSPTALKIAAEFRDRHPLAAEASGEVRSLPYDGHRLDLPDASVDRIVCFDSFHHVPNAAEALAEFGRVLKPGGLAGFSEPGPEHSRSAQSQFEMRTYGVLENDVDVPRIWELARARGFDDVKLVAFNPAPSYVSLREFEELLRGGPALAHAARLLRDFTANVRTFTLRREGVEPLDSRSASGLSCDIEVSLPGRLDAGVPTPFSARVTNTGTAVWLPSSAARGGVCLGVHLYRGDHLADFDFAWTAVSEAETSPGATVTVSGTLSPLPPGRHRLEFDCVARKVRWFSQTGSAVRSVIVEVG